jgi:hypothetical protein
MEKAKNKICGMIARCDHFRREPYLRRRRPRAADFVPRRVPDTFARAGQYSQSAPAKGTMRDKWFGRRHAVDAWATMGDVAS